MGPLKTDVLSTTPPLDLYLDFNKKFVRVSSEAQNGGSELKQLLERAHIVIEDGSLGRRSRRSGLEAWGKVATPVVWLSITPFGATGPYKDYSSYSLTLAHGSGEAYMNFTGDATRSIQIHPGSVCLSATGDL